MARISGIEIKDQLKIDYALTQISGIGWSLSRKILDSAKIDHEKRVSELTAAEFAKITSEIDAYVTEGDLARQIRANITRLKTIGTYRGIRHTRGLPSRGQRTRSNARTKRGKRKTVGAFKKSDITKMQQTK